MPSRWRLKGEKKADKDLIMPKDCICQGKFHELTWIDLLNVQKNSICFSKFALFLEQKRVPT